MFGTVASLLSSTLIDYKDICLCKRERRLFFLQKKKIYIIFIIIITEDAQHTNRHTAYTHALFIFIALKDPTLLRGSRLRLPTLFDYPCL